MKKIPKLVFQWVIIFLCTLFFSCNNKNEKVTRLPKEAMESDWKMSPRDYSINKSNAYSDIFLDSLKLEAYITKKKLNDTLSRRIRSFYNVRNFQFAWFDSKGFMDHTLNFWNLHEYYNICSDDSNLDDKALKKRMDALLTETSFKVRETDNGFANTELTLTEHFIHHILTNYEKGAIRRREMERFIPLQKHDAMLLADSMLSKKHKDNKHYSDINQPYKLLSEQMQKYYTIVKNNGYEPIVIKEKRLQKGAATPTVLAVKKRLGITGELQEGDTSMMFSENLVVAVKTFQNSHGLLETGIITPGLVKVMNVPAIQRLKQLLINMDRMRWIPTDPEGNLLIVNIPEFVLHVFEGKKQVFKMPVVVGKEGHNTTIFTGNINQVVFSPYWNVPPNIVRKEIVPAMRQNSGYLKSNNMEQTGIDEDGVPIIRQLPGADNSLGKVKFLFPNNYDIYFHDTPAKELFNQEKRAYSHGCIRLSDPVKMANYLLRNQKEWTPDKVNIAMNSGVEKVVKLTNEVPVLITYFTAWVGGNGLLNFRDDVYGKDTKLIGKRFVK